MHVNKLKLSITVDKESQNSLQDQIFSQICHSLSQGEHKAWDRLPSIRVLAKQLSVAKNTIIAVYDRLVDEGYLISQENRGFFIAPGKNDQKDYIGNGLMIPLEPVPTDFSNFSHTSSPKVSHIPGSIPVSYDFRLSHQNPELFPERKWRRYLQQSLVRAKRYMMEYPEAAGVWVLREELAEYLTSRRGMVVEPEDITIVGGIQEALSIICALQKKPTPAVIETPGYSGAYEAFKFHKHPVYPVPVDDNGLQIDKMPNVNGAMVFTTPSHQFPLGVSMSVERRCELLHWADNHDALILEDDYDGDLRSLAHLLKPLKTLDYSQRVVYMGSFSKVFAPGIRLGYMVTPRDLTERIAQYKGLLNLGCNWLFQTAIGDMFYEGFFSSHLREIRRTMTRRRERLTSALQQYMGTQCKIRGSQNGMHLSLELARTFNAEKFAQVAMKRGVRVYPLSELPVSTPNRADLASRLLVLGYGSVPETAMEDAVELLSETLYAFRPAASA